jgi:site-specific recombinase XerD
MHDLIPATDTDISVLDQHDVDRVLRYAAASKAASTLKCYAYDWGCFRSWCDGRGAAFLPAKTAIVCAYLSGLAESGMRSTTIGRRCAAIAHFHRQAGHPTPTDHDAVKTTLSGIRRTIGTARTKKAPATADLIMQMLAKCPDTLSGKRDRALLALGFAGAFRRSELCALMVEDLIEVPDGYRVMVRRSKTDQTGEGVEVAIPRGYKVRPVEAVQAWLQAADITAGPVLRPVLLGQRVQSCSLSHEAVSRIIKGYIAKIGLDPKSYAAHSLRSGMLTSCAEAGANVFAMANHSRHKSLDTLRGYVRSANLFREFPGAAFT